MGMDEASGDEAADKEADVEFHLGAVCCWALTFTPVSSHVVVLRSGLQGPSKTSTAAAR